MLIRIKSFFTTFAVLLSTVFGVFGMNMDFSELLSGLLDSLAGLSDNEPGVIELYDFKSEDVKLDSKTGINYVNNILVVFFEDGVDDEERTEIISAVDGQYVGRIDAVRQWQIEVPSAGYSSLESKCEKLMANPLVKNAYVETANKISTQTTIPDDPWEGFSWDESNPSGYNWHLEATHVPSAWDYNDRFSHVKLGVVDSGFYTQHVELVDKVSFPTSNYNFASINSEEYHGTNVASIIGAKANNGIGLSGIVWDSDLLIVDCLPSGTQNFNGTTYLYAGVVACVENGAKAVNISMGTVLDDGETLTTAQINSYARNASSYISTLLDEEYEFVVVQSAGNGSNQSQISMDSINNGMFACVTLTNTGLSTAKAKAVNDRIIIVAAAENLGNNSYQQASYSNAGTGVDIAAPGSSIHGAYRVSNGVSQYCRMSGTSQAAPIVTGIAGLVFAANPYLTGAQVKSIICDPNNSRYVAADNTSSKHPLVSEYNLIDAQLCVEAVLADMPHADYTQVDANVTLAQGIDRALYSAESLEALDAAIENIEYLLPQESQSDVDAYNLALSAALYALDPADSLEEMGATTKISDISENLMISDYTPSFNVPGAYLGTGSSVRLYNSSSIPVIDYVFVVAGDLNGDGLVTYTDQSMMKNGIYHGTSSWSDAQILAADYNGDMAFNIADYNAVKTLLKYS